MNWRTRVSGVCRPWAGMILLLAPSLVLGQDALSWRFQEGSQWVYERTQDRTNEMKSSDGRQATHAEHRVTSLKVLVTKVHTDRSADLKVTITRIRETQRTPDGPLEYDSKDDRQDPKRAASLARRLDPMIGLEFTCRMTAQGEVHDARLTAESEKRLKDVPLLLTVLGNKQTLRYMVPSVLLPQGKVGVGTTWKESGEFTDPIMGTRKIATSFTWKGSSKKGEQELDEIALDLSWVLEPRKDSPIRMEVKDQKTTGTVQFDRTRGILTLREEKEQFRSVTTFMGTAFETNSQGTVTWKLLLVKP